jgi:hypothetical protein
VDTSLRRRETVQTLVGRKSPGVPRAIEERRADEQEHWCERIRRNSRNAAHCRDCPK